MSIPQKYVFNNTFPNHYLTEETNNLFSDHSTNDDQSLTLQNLELIDGGNRWTDSEIKILLSCLSENFDLYRKEKKKFCAKVALKLENKRTTQVKSKIQALITKFEEENREATGKGRSHWEYFEEMNEIFGNRENVQPDYLSSSIDLNKV